MPGLCYTFCSMRIEGLALMEPSKIVEETTLKKTPGLFEPGGPGGPGRPAGSRNRATLALDTLAESEAHAILQDVMKAAKGGDLRAAEILLARIWPVRKGRPVTLNLPVIKTAADVVAAVGVVADAVGAGDITPDEGHAVAGILEAKRKAIETVDLENRVAALAGC
jgi:hypothetical protein